MIDSSFACPHSVSVAPPLRRLWASSSRAVSSSWVTGDTRSRLAGGLAALETHAGSPARPSPAFVVSERCLAHFRLHTLRTRGMFIARCLCPNYWIGYGVTC